MKKQKLPIAQKAKVPESADLENLATLIQKKIRAEKIICFGSKTSSASIENCFRSEEGLVQRVQNSYCLLVVPSVQESVADILIQQRLEEELKHIASLAIIVHRMPEINLALTQGSSFFTSIYLEGKILYDRGEEMFAEPILDVLEVGKKTIRREEFWLRWFQLSDDFLTGARFYASHQKGNLALFMLHQALQHCYSGMLRVYSGFRSNTNGLRRLMKLIDVVVPEASFSYTKQSPEYSRLSALLLKGFGDARYNNKFEASHDEVARLIDRVADIMQFSNSLCLSHIKKLKEDNKIQ